MKTRRAEQAASLVQPRLLRRAEAACFLGVSLAQLDFLRITGELRPVAMPSRLGGPVRTPLYDVEDLSAAINRWKADADVR